MPNIKLSYFDFDGGRGEDARLALFIAGVNFDDDRIKPPNWPVQKSSTPFGGLPVLTMEGKPGQLAQSNAVLTFLGRSYNLHPADLWEAARHEMVMAAVEDLRAATGATIGIKDPDEKKRAREELANGLMQTWGANLEAQIGEGPFFGGAKLQVVDLKVFVMVHFFARGGADHIPGDVFKAFPKLVSLYEAVKAHPKVAAYYQARQAAN